MSIKQGANQSDRSLSAYFAEIRPTATEATSLHREWTQKLAQLVAALDEAGLESVLDRLHNVGLFFDISFSACHAQLDAVQSPTSAAHYHTLWLTWLDHMVLASRSLTVAASTRDRTRLGQCRGNLSDARSVLQDLGGEAVRLEAELSRERSRFAA